jgi:hypothetical protein
MGFSDNDFRKQQYFFCTYLKYDFIKGTRHILNFIYIFYFLEKRCTSATRISASFQVTHPLERIKQREQTIMQIQSTQCHQIMKTDIYTTEYLEMMGVQAPVWHYVSLL